MTTGLWGVRRARIVQPACSWARSGQLDMGGSMGMFGLPVVERGSGGFLVSFAKGAA
jgi:hypothetical protein